MICMKLPWIRVVIGWYFNEVICINRHCRGKTFKSMRKKWIHIDVCGCISTSVPTALSRDRPYFTSGSWRIPSGRSSYQKALGYITYGTDDDWWHSKTRRYVDPVGWRNRRWKIQTELDCSLCKVFPVLMETYNLLDMINFLSLCCTIISGDSS